MCSSSGFSRFGAFRILTAVFRSIPHLLLSKMLLFPPSARLLAMQQKCALSKLFSSSSGMFTRGSSDVQELDEWLFKIQAVTQT